MVERHFQLDREKLKQAVLFIASQCPADRLGNVKLHKALYFADMLFFLQEGRPLTGTEYLKQKFGPVARHLSSAVSELVNEGRLRVTEDEYFGLYKKSYTPIGELAVDRLSEEEQRLLTDMTEFVCGFSAKEISEFSHNAAWEMMELGEVIPYFTALQLLPAEINDLDRQWAIDSAQAYAAEPLPV